MERATRPGTPRLLRAINERALLEQMRRTGPVSRAQLARDSGLSKPTVSQALTNLERAGLVRALGLRAAPRGRAPILYETDPGAAHVLAIDIGRAWIRVAVADLAGTVIHRRDERNRAGSADALVRTVHELADAATGAQQLTAPVIHTVVGSPGVFDPRAGRLQLANNLPGWSRPGPVDDLAQALSGSVAVHNDINLAAIAERTYGAGQDVHSLAYLSVGTGVGMGIVIDDVLHTGAHGAAGEVAFHPLPGEPSVDDDAARRGAFEAAAAADGVARTARAMGMGDPPSAKDTFDAARRGDALALAAVGKEAERLAMLIASVSAILDPELVVLGGGVGSNTDLLLDPLRRELQRLSPLRPRIVGSELGPEAVVLGAIATALDTARELAFQQLAGDGFET
jgi:predicted NBD/HSP70 family sugar kinase